MLLSYIPEAILPLSIKSPSCFYFLPPLEMHHSTDNIYIAINAQ